MKNAFPVIVLVMIFFISCVSNNSLTNNQPKNIKVTVLSGSISLHILGVITAQQNYSAYNLNTKNSVYDNQDVKWDIPQGTETINQTTTVSEGNNYNYTLQSGETVTCIFTAVSDKAEITIYNGRNNQNYIIHKTDKANLIVGFTN